MAKLQKLQKELSEKEEELRETEYSRYLSDSEDMLNKLYKEYEELATKKMDDFMELVKKGLETANANMSVIASYFSKVAKDNGYDIETNGLFDGSTGGIGENVGKTVADIEKDKTATSTTASSTPTANNTPSVPTEAKSFAVATPPQAVSTQEDMDKAKVSMVKEFIAENAHDAKKDKKDYGAVNQAIYNDKANAYKGTGRVLSLENLKLLCKHLGITYNGTGENGRLYKKLHEIGYKGFKKGGIAKLIKDKGEDGITLARNGEGFIAPEHVQPIQELVESVPDINEMTESTKRLTEKLPETDNVIRTPDGIELIPVNPEDLIRELQSRSNNAMPDSSNMAMPNVADFSNILKPIVPDLSKMVKANMPDVQPVNNTNNDINLNYSRHSRESG